ncbi:hypothetical protein B0H19DRAFT_1060480 [Mycena capillaripes]|nr:hypothetical protein B0H19DRAFT_1060480 [Mycena capillaripes]
MFTQRATGNSTESVRQAAPGFDQVLHPGPRNLLKEGCAYYLVEHTMRKMFWVQDQSTEDLDLETVISTTGLDAQLWAIHVEYFPANYGTTGLGNQWINELICVFSYGRLDKLTCSDSIFPYSVKECGQILELLESSPIVGRFSNGYVIYLSARLWNVVACCPDSTSIPWVSVLACALSLHFFKTYLMKLEDAYPENVSLLIQCYPLQHMTGGEVLNHVDTIRSPTFKFQIVALTFPLPGALGIWGPLVMLVNCGIILIRYFGPVSATVISVACGMGALFFLWVTSAAFKSRVDGPPT